MSRATVQLGRWLGALVLDDGERQLLIGNPKEPTPLVPETLAPPWWRPLAERVAITDAVELEGGGELTALAGALALRLLIERNGAVSERLWRLVRHDGARRVGWLVETPMHVWQIVRDNVLRCS